MLINSCKNLSCFLRFHTSRLISRQFLKSFHNLSRRTGKSYRGEWNFNRQKKNSKAIGIVTVVGIGAYSSSFIVNKSDPLILEKNENELLKNEVLKEDIELLNNYGPVPYLLIGSGPVAIAAYRAIRIKDPTAKILMISEELFNPYNTASLSSELWYLKSHDSDVKKSRIFYDDYYLSVQQLLNNKNGGLALIRGKKVIKIDPISQCAFLDAGEQITYKKCLFVPTAKPQNLAEFQKAEEGIKKHVTAFHNFKDFLKLEKLSREVKTIAVIGGGILGTELAAGLNEYSKSVGLNVIQVFPEPRHLNNILPEYLSMWLRNRFQNKGIHIVPHVNIKSVSKCKDKVKLHLSNEEIISVDHVVLAIGSEPNTDIALLSELETDYKLGGLLVNAEMKARKNLWIAGESASFYDISLGRCKVKYPENAIHSGHTAGENMVGDEKPFHYESNWWSVLSSDIFCEGIGETDAKLETVGVFIKPCSGKLEPVDESLLINRSKSQVMINETAINKSSNISHPMPVNKLDDYKKGIIFYLKENIVVGILLWNVISDTNIAKKVIKERKTCEEIIEIARLFQSAIFTNKSVDDMESASD